MGDVITVWYSVVYASGFSRVNIKWGIMMKMSKTMKQQRGFSLLEAMLAIAVILAASIGAVELYLSAKGNSDLQKTEEIAQQVASAAQQYLSSSYDTADVVSTEQLLNGGLLPKGIVVDDEIRGPWGNFTVDSVTDGEKQQFYVTAFNFPRKQAVDYCQHMFANFAVFVGATPSGTAIATLSDCATEIADNRPTITIGSPRSAFSETADGE